jgi:anaerobic C4-dicarboxylate transporter DcuA
MDTFVVILEAGIVLSAIFLGVRTGGIGLGLWGVAGTAILIFVFGLNPASPPLDAFLIIIAVITASATMQAAGGIDYLVEVASKIIRRSPRRIVYVAPLVAFLFTVGAGTSNIFLALIPVIYETSYHNGIRPERALATSTITSGLGITASPVSAAMAAYLTLVPSGFTLVEILAITMPASIVACILTSVVQSRIGRELADDPEFQRRVAASDITMPPALVGSTAADPRDRPPTAGRREQAGQGDNAAAIGPGTVAGGGERVRRDAAGAPSAPGGPPPDGTAVLKPGAIRSAMIFLVGVVVITVMGLFSRLRPEVTVDGETGPLGVTTVIELVMFTVALVILLSTSVKPGDVLRQSLLAAGFVAAIALLGIAWMAETFIENNIVTVVEPIEDFVKNHPLFLFLAVALFLVAGLTNSQSATTHTLIPLGLAGGLPVASVTAMWPSVVGVWLFPANGPQIAAVNIDRTGTTRLSQVPVWHSFTIPMLVSWVSVVATGLLIAGIFF